MFLQALTLYQFRNLLDQEIAFSPSINLISGRNGQGKTNLVEAIHLLASARSFRTAAIDELPRWQHQECSVFAKVCAEPRNLEAQLYDVGVSIERGARNCFFNRVRLASVAEFLGKLLVVTFSPTDIALVKGAPALRRKFLDKHLIDCIPQLARDLFQLQRALRTKGKLLKEKTSDEAALDVCDKMIAEHGTVVSLARKEFADRVALRANLCLQSIAPLDGGLHVRLRSSFVTEAGAASESSALEKLQHVRARERHLKTCLLGPQRDELEIKLGEHDARAFASQGQARSIVLALKLAMVSLIEETRNEAPILILDDFDSELDATRSEALLTEVRRTGRQVFITGVSPRSSLAIDGREIRRFEVSQGLVKATDS